MTDKFTALSNVRQWLNSTVASSISLSSSADHTVFTALTVDSAADTIRVMLERHYSCVPIVGSANSVVNVLTLQDVVIG